MKEFRTIETFTKDNLYNIFQSNDISFINSQLRQLEKEKILKISKKNERYLIKQHKDINFNIVKHMSENARSYTYNDQLNLLELNWSEETHTQLTTLIMIVSVISLII